MKIVSSPETDDNIILSDNTSHSSFTTEKRHELFFMKFRVKQ
jgi:hypothetical protein